MKQTLPLTRRRMLQLTAPAAFALAAGWNARGVSARASHGAITGEPTAALRGAEVLVQGGNAVDAIVTAALVAAVVSPNNCGIGGYGGHMTLALDGGKRVTSIDFNSTAPAALKADAFLDAAGNVRAEAHDHGWLAAGVPGTLAGLEMALRKFGTRSFREAVAPAIKLAKDGFPVTTGVVAGIRAAQVKLRQDPASARLLLRDGGPPVVGSRFANPELAAMLETLARRNSVDSFYRGDIAQRIAEAFQKNGGLVTTADLAAYRAREVKPLHVKYGGADIFTAPPTAGGLTALETLLVLDALQWSNMLPGNEKTHARVEALRLAWRDRLQLLGDPDKARVPVAKLLSKDYAGELAGQVRAAVRAKKPLDIQIESRAQGGTVHLSCVDASGNLAALTLTHGNSYGACVTVDGLGLTLGHGMSRFEARPGHPNSPGPGKRPLHNMCPTVVLRGGKPVLALGGAGGRKIPNALLDVLLAFVGDRLPLEQASEAPRLNTEGGLDLRIEKRWPAAEVEYLKDLGYKVTIGASARISAVSFDPQTGECSAATRI
ncbi:MAG: gamma-glutamyltransferase [Verrucomicrobiota bacterium]